MDLFDPDWPYWKQIPHATLLECVLLSLGANPHEFQDHWWENQNLQKRCDIAIKNVEAGRLRIASRNRGIHFGAKEFVPVTWRDIHNQVSRNPTELLLYVPIDIAVFSRWALSLDWELPPEMVAMAEANLPNILLKAAKKVIAPLLQSTASKSTHPDPSPLKVGIEMPPPSYPGRPTLMSAIEAEMKRRSERGELESSLSREATFLAQWAAIKFADSGTNPPGKTSIENATRHLYRSLRVGSPS